MNVIKNISLLFKPESKQAETSKAGKEDTDDHHNIRVPASISIFKYKYMGA